MQNRPTRTILGIVTDFLATQPSSQEITDYLLLDDLIDKNREGELKQESSCN